MEYRVQPNKGYTLNWLQPVTVFPYSYDLTPTSVPFRAENSIMYSLQRKHDGVEFGLLTKQNSPDYLLIVCKKALESPKEILKWTKISKEETFFNNYESQSFWLFCTKQIL